MVTKKNLAFFTCLFMSSLLILWSCQSSESKKNAYDFPEGIGDPVFNVENVDSAINARKIEDSLNKADSFLFVDKNFLAAANIYRKYFDTMDAERECTLAMMYARGQGVKKDIAQSLTLLRKAANKGSGMAKNNIGFAYYKGTGVKKDYNLAMKWYLESVRDSIGIAMSNIGILYSNGYGVVKNCNAALSWFTRSANNGSIFGMNNLASMYLNGNCIKKDTSIAIQWLQRAIEKGDTTVMSQINKLKPS